MASLMSMISAAETPAVEVSSYEQLLEADQELVMALLDLHKDVPANQELSELLHIYYINTVRTREFCAVLQHHLDAIHEALHEYGPLNLLEFFHDFWCLYWQQLLMRDSLQSFDSSSDDRSDCVKALKKVSAVFFTAAAGTSAAVAAANATRKRPEVAASAAAASIVLGAVGNWVHSRLKKHEAAMKKQEEIINFMIVGDRITMNGLSNIRVSAWRLQLESESMPEMLDDGDEDGAMEKLAAMERSFEELQGQANDYYRNVSWVRTLVVQTIIKHATNN